MCVGVFSGLAHQQWSQDSSQSEAAAPLQAKHPLVDSIYAILDPSCRSRTFKTTESPGFCYLYVVMRGPRFQVVWGIVGFVLLWSWAFLNWVAGGLWNYWVAASFAGVVLRDSRCLQNSAAGLPVSLFCFVQKSAGRSAGFSGCQYRT